MHDSFLLPHPIHPFCSSQCNLRFIKTLCNIISILFLIKIFQRNLLYSLQAGFCNIVKRAKDQMNNLWVAEASENSSYFLSFNTPHCSHLKDAAASAERWAKISTLVCILELFFHVRSVSML